MAWKVLTDQSERPTLGKTTASCVRNDHGIVFSGLLANLPGNVGRVGFAIARHLGSPSFLTYDQLEFRARSTRADLQFSIALEDSQMHTDHGELSFEKQFQPSLIEQEFNFSILELKPKIRGKPAPDFHLKRNEIVSFSFQILRSRQAAYTLRENPLPFEVSVSWDDTSKHGIGF